MTMPPILKINLNDHMTECWACGADTPSRWGLPIGRGGDLVPNDEEMVGGVPCCRTCHDAHARGLLTEANLREWRKTRKLDARAMQSLMVRE